MGSEACQGEVPEGVSVRKADSYEFSLLFLKNKMLFLPAAKKDTADKQLGEPRMSAKFSNAAPDFDDEFSEDFEDSILGESDDDLFDEFEGEDFEGGIFEEDEEVKPKKLKPTILGDEEEEDEDDAVEEEGYEDDLDKDLDGEDEELDDDDDEEEDLDEEDDEEV